MVTVPSVVGELGFLPNHCDYVGLMSAGTVEYHPVDESTSSKLVVTGGLCTFGNNTLKLLADTVEMPAESVDRVNYAKNRAELEIEKSRLSEYDPEFEVVAQKLAQD